MGGISTYPGLRTGIESRHVRRVNGLDVHVLTAGRADARRGALILLHGFPELSFSWRHVMLPLADAGFHVVAPDQRGFGLTVGWDGDFDGRVERFSAANLVEDVVQLLGQMQLDSVAGIVGHDFGSLVAARAALVRPDLFQSVILMSAPVGPPAPEGAEMVAFDAISAGLAALDPPREHYQCYFSDRRAEPDMLRCGDGLAAFLRGYIHGKSGDWPGNDPHPLAGWTPQDLAELPSYYVMDAGVGMCRTVAPYYADYLTRGGCSWLTDAELQVYVDTFASTGFQGGLNWYRCLTGGIGANRFADHVGAPITVPAAFIAGDRDWGIHQTPGALQRLQAEGCSDFRLLRLIPGAGHWVQQERPDEVIAALLEFLDN